MKLVKKTDCAPAPKGIDDTRPALLAANLVVITVLTLISCSPENTSLQESNTPDPPRKEPDGTSTPAPDRKSLAELARETRPALLLLETVSEKGDRSIGTGFFVSNDGKLITNWHVVEGAVELVASEVNEDGSRGAEYSEIEILRKNVPGDLALLQAKTEPKVFLQFGSPAEIEIGEPIFTFGNPQGLTGSLSEGIVSARRDFEGGYSWVQITAPISPGSSGSPVISLDGRVWGVVSWLHKGGQNLNFSAPVEAVADLLEGKNTGDVAPGQLGPVWTIENEKAVEEEIKAHYENNPSELEDLESARFLCRKYPESIRAKEYLASTYVSLELYPEAKSTLLDLLTIDPENATSLLLLAKCYQEELDWNSSKTAASRGIKSDPSNFQMWASLFYAHMNLEDYREAVPAGKSAVMTGEDTLADLPGDPSDSDLTQQTMDELALLCYDFGNTLIYRARAEIDDGESTRRAKRAYSESRLMFEKSISLYRKLIASFPEDSDYLENCNWYVSESLKGKGVSYLEEQDPVKALPLFKEAIQIAPHNCNAMLYAGDAYKHQGNISYAKESYRRAYEAAYTEEQRIEASQRLERLRR